MDVPWYGTFVPQAAAFVVVTGFFGVVALIWLRRMTLGRGRNVESRVPMRWRLIGLLALVGLAGTVLGGAALAELLVLGDVHADFIIGGPLVAGASPLSRAASAMGWTTVMLAAAFTFFTAREWLSERSKGASVAMPWLTITMLPVLSIFIGWAAYWGLLSLRLLG